MNHFYITCHLLILALPTFAFSQQPLLTTSPVWSSLYSNESRSVACGDVDRDGDIDIVFGNYRQQNTLFLNNGGMFQTTPAWSSFPALTTESVALGDVDGDGDLDLVCGNINEGNTLYRNEAGAFESNPSWVSSGANWTTSVALGDVDGDGDLDLICGNHDERNTLYMNEGGMFQATPAWSSSPALATESVALGDVDGDGDLDLVCGNFEQQNTLYVNIEGVLQTAPTWFSVPEMETNSISLGDVDGDGDLDLACANIFQENTLYLNENGVFQQNPFLIFPLVYTFSVTMGDVDGDGDLDLVFGNFDSSTNIHLNEGGIFPALPAWSSGLSDRAYGIALGDMDGDGDLDLACATAKQNRLYENNRGMYQNIPCWMSKVSNGTTSIAIADIDGDGDIDVACGNRFQQNTLYLNDNGVLQTTPAWLSDPANETWGIALGDVNGDGYPDLVCGNDEQRNTLYLNEGGMLQTSPAWLSSPANDTWCVALGDVDGNGDLDLVCGNGGSNRSTLYLNEGGMLQADPAWTSWGDYAITIGIALGDVDRDGDLDLVCGNSGSRNSLYLNDGGIFEAVPSWLSSLYNRTFTVALGDVDGNGYPDLICGNPNEQNTIYLNEDGMLHEFPDWNLPSGETRSVASEDVDGDGDFDIMCGNEAYSNTLFINEGGLFQTVPSWSSGLPLWTYGIALGDIDGDGDPDLICGNQGLSTLYLNQKRPIFHGNPEAPTNHLPNNSAYFRDVAIEESGINSRLVHFTVVDVEGDPMWIFPDFRFEKDPRWHPAEINGQAGAIGPFSASSAGQQHSFEWDITRAPFDSRNVVFRLHALEMPYHVSTLYHIDSYRTETGALFPIRPEITVSTNGLVLPTVTVGDTVSSELTISNTGTAPLSITAFILPTEEMWIGPPAPLELQPTESAELTVSYSTLSTDKFWCYLQIESNDPLQQVDSVIVATQVRALDFTLVNLFPDGVIEDRKDLDISIVMDDLVQVDSARVFIREGGKLNFQAVRLTRIPDPLNEQYVCSVPAASITSRGVEYYVEVHNGEARASADLQRLRKRVDGLDFPYQLPAEKYRLISIPLEMEGTILGALEELGGIDITVWRMFGYYDLAGNPSRRGYWELPNDSIYGFESGRSYWLVTRKSGLRLNTGPTRGLSSPTESMFALVLEPQWNLIGNPFDFPVAWDSIMVGSLPMEEAESSIVERPVSWVVGQGYQDADVLEPFDGYWIKNITDSDVVLRIPPRAATSGTTLDKPASPAGPEGATQENGWRITIKTSCDGAVDAFNVFGVNRNAASEWDRNDRSEPPMSPAPSVSLYFPHSSWEKHPGNYTMDIRGAYQTLESSRLGFTQSDEELWGQLWRFDVAKNFSAGNAADETLLEFEGLEGVPAEAIVCLVDRHLEKSIDIRKEGIYRFWLGKRNYISADDDARFVLLVGSGEFIETHEDEMPAPPARTVLHQNYPNPFNPSTIVRYEIAGNENVAISIYDVNGSPVKVLYSGRREPGRYEVRWNGENEKGARVASGIYFYRLVAGESVQTKKMVLLR